MSSKSIDVLLITVRILSVLVKRKFVVLGFSNCLISKIPQNFNISFTCIYTEKQSYNWNIVFFRFCFPFSSHFLPFISSHFLIALLVSIAKLSSFFVPYPSILFYFSCLEIYFLLFGLFPSLVFYFFSIQLVLK